jgi:galactitol-specific phosphotransferase system IIB component
MRILVFCQYGMNRSRYLAEYLVEEGYDDVQFAGVKDPDRKKIQKAINGADIIITVSDLVQRVLRERYHIGSQRMIGLQVDDTPKVAIPGYPPFQGDEWFEFQRGYVYPELKKQLSKFLPLR